MEQLDSKIWFFSFSGIPTAEICPPNSPSPQPGISKNQASGEMLMGCTMGKAVVTGTASLSSRSPGQQVEGSLDLPAVHLAEEEMMVKGKDTSSLKPGSQGVGGRGRSRAQVCGLNELGTATGGDIVLPLQRGTMGFWKFPPFLVLSILVLYQAGMFHTAPMRSAFGSPFDPATLSEEESRLLLAAMVNDYEQMKAREMQKQRAQGSGISVQKRSCNTATCMTHRLVGLLSRSGSMVRSNLLPTKMGFKVFGGRRRNFWI
ncbi:calcitonin receptor-stimulating peptide 1 isoform X1 [Sus scrofa]|nr:calcitonin receptor-stimulating peptide 1 isoform X1 [Sus scrofa]XP_020935850.1 calcitonin receptor-stimulating peptide 1 isoform X1 [Sus scrofa]XP_020935851.1 calcitonin receptor-stimulating peptide 1 isoform X1 [Sus scrofa]XP_020935854.1 calcitonin receptor-stimulating peptide 1 isoform X1 [Sus scrofa]XP_020935863.1 calcitonin receptor-stimulating peptide 1 isoform X1 [Sus scrofa]